MTVEAKTPPAAWKKGQKPWMIRMNVRMVYTVERVQVTQVRDDTVFVRIKLPAGPDNPNGRESVVVDATRKDMFRTEREAILAAVNRERAVIAKHTDNVNELLARLAR